MRGAITQLFFVNLLQLAFSVLAGPLVARLLGPEGRGDLALAMLWPNTLALAAPFGIDIWMGRAAARPGADLRRLGQQAVVLAGLMSMAPIGLGILLIPRLLPASQADLVPVAWLLLAHIPLWVLSLLFAVMAISCGDLRGHHISRLAQSSLYLLFVAVLWAVGLGQVPYVAGAFLAATVCTAVLGWLNWERTHASQVPSGSVPPEGVWAAVQGSAGFGCSTLVELTYAQLPMGLLSVFVAAEEIGFFAVSMTIASVQEAFGGAVTRVLFAQVAATSGAEDGQAAQRGELLATRLRCTTLVYVVLCLGMTAVLPPLIPWIFGEAFAPATWLAAGVIPAMTVKAIARNYNFMLKGDGVVAPGLWVNALGSVVLAGTALWWLPTLGLYGIVVAMLAGSTLQLVVLNRVAARHFRVSPGAMWGVRATEIEALAGVLRRYLPRAS